MRIYPRAHQPFRIVEEHNVTAALEAAREKYPRFDELWEGLCWLIARNGHNLGPERQIGGVGHFIFTMEGDAVAGYPRIVVAYRYGATSFTLRVITISDPPR